jgi:probable F420-dependent oxidoreductase
MAGVELGTLGVWISRRVMGETPTGEAARVAEDLGYGTLWLGASPQLRLLRPLLEASEKIVVATGIANIWGYEPGDLAAEYADLAADFGERVLVGIGVGHPESAGDYSKPYSAMRAFLDGVDAAPVPVPADRRCLAALAPRMLALSAERTLGAAPYFVPVAHTAAARELLGAGPLLAPELGFVHDEDTERARATGREFTSRYVELSNYGGNLLRHGFSESDLADGGSGALVDALIPHGSAAAIAGAVRAHLEAGADHVAVQAIGEPGIPRRGWAAVAAAFFG